MRVRSSEESGVSAEEDYPPRSGGHKSIGVVFPRRGAHRHSLGFHLGMATPRSENRLPENASRRSPIALSPFIPTTASAKELTWYQVVTLSEVLENHAICCLCFYDVSYIKYSKITSTSNLSHFDFY